MISLGSNGRRTLPSAARQIEPATSPLAVVSSRARCHDPPRSASSGSTLLSDRTRAKNGIGVLRSVPGTLTATGGVS